MLSRSTPGATRGKGKVILKIDYRNAFNCVDRLSMLRAVDANLPELAPWVRWCYLEHSSLFYGGDTIKSQRGAQQGDPLGPLLFSLTIHQMALELKGHPGLDGTLWYLDDGSLRGSPKAVFEAYQVLCTRSSELGLEVNANKCELISTGGVSKEDLEAVGFTLNEGGQDAMGEGGFRLLDVDGFDFLGIPIGSAAFCEEYMARKVDDSRRNLEALVDLGDSQAAFYVLRYCEGYCRMVFYMRGIPQCAEYLTAFDDLIDRCLAALLHDPDGALPELARAQGGASCGAWGGWVSVAQWTIGRLRPSPLSQGTCNCRRPWTLRSPGMRRDGTARLRSTTPGYRWRFTWTGLSRRRSWSSRVCRLR